MKTDKASQDFSRRDMLLLAAAGGGVIAAGLVAIVPAEAGAKVSQKAVNYQSTPHGKARCDGCAQWQPPAACKVVTGTISPAGWCTIYAPKS